MCVRVCGQALAVFAGPGQPDWLAQMCKAWRNARNVEAPERAWPSFGPERKVGGACWVSGRLFGEGHAVLLWSLRDAGPSGGYVLKKWEKKQDTFPVVFLHGKFLNNSVNYTW